MKKNIIILALFSTSMLLGCSDAIDEIEIADEAEIIAEKPVS